MQRKELIARFVAGILVYFVLYSAIILLTSNSYNLLETVIMAIFWSIGMSIFEIGWKKYRSDSDTK